MVLNLKMVKGTPYCPMRGCKKIPLDAVSIPQTSKHTSNMGRRIIKLTKATTTSKKRFIKLVFLLF
jgi:hypothetical protein